MTDSQTSENYLTSLDFEIWLRVVKYIIFNIKKLSWSQIHLMFQYSLFLLSKYFLRPYVKVGGFVKAFCNIFCSFIHIVVSLISV